MKKSAVIGFPISHSLSPILHNFLLKKYQIDGSYEAIPINPENLELEFDYLILKADYQGLNVTIPFKEDIFRLFKERGYQITPKALSVQAINTIYKENDQIIGSNSDIYGFEQNLLINSQNKLKNGSALLIGAGGAASAALFSLSSMFDNIYIMNRTRKKAENLAKSQKSAAKIQIIDDLPLEIAQKLDLIVNSTSIGMKNNDFEHSFDLNQVNNDCFVYDLVYNPLYTELLKKAQETGKPVITGIGMLIYQAFEGFEKWFGVKPNLNPDEIQHLTDLLISQIK